MTKWIGVDEAVPKDECHVLIFDGRNMEIAYFKPGILFHHWYINSRGFVKLAENEGFIPKFWHEIPQPPESVMKLTAHIKKDA